MSDNHGRDGNYSGEALSPSDIDFAWHWLLHEDNLLASRVNFFLVAESMFLAAFATLLAADRTSAALVVDLAGISVAVMWWHVARWSLRKTFWKLRAIVRTGKPLYDEVCAGRRSRFTGHRVLTELLPLTTVATWIVVLCINCIANTIAPISKTCGK
jgi:hypothetical protein